MAGLHRSSRKALDLCNLLKELVGAIGFEPTPPAHQGRCATSAALRPGMTSRIDSKALSDFDATPTHDFWPRRIQTVHRCATSPDRAHSFPLLVPISLARRLSFSRASRLNCNFIGEYSSKTCAFPGRSNPRRVGMHHIQIHAPILLVIPGHLLALPVHCLVLLVDLAASGPVAIGL
jgi:hypothetical protein